MCSGVTGDAEQRGAAATGRRAMGGSLRQGHGPAGSGRVSAPLRRRVAVQYLIESWPLQCTRRETVVSAQW